MWHDPLDIICLIITIISNGIVLSDEIVINNNLQPVVDLYGSVKPPNWAYNSAGKSSNSYVEIACVCISQHKYKQNYFFFLFYSGPRIWIHSSGNHYNRKLHQIGHIAVYCKIISRSPKSHKRGKTYSRMIIYLVHYTGYVKCVI